MHDIDQLLQNTRRTFALAIAQLPEPTKRDVAIAYLVFRIADTLEDADGLSHVNRIRALNQFAELLRHPNEEQAVRFASRWSNADVSKNIHHQELIRYTPLVLQELSGREMAVRQLITEHARRTILGMTWFLSDSSMRLRTLAELRSYCYCVAGVVGELLTELFSNRIREFSHSEEIMNQAMAFGEGLQLVNILRDSDEDMRCGRFLIPPSVDRESLFRLARANLQRASEYVVRLRHAGADEGYVAFTQLPLDLAFATLDKIQRCGPGSKISRSVVSRIQANVTHNAKSKSVSHGI